MRKLFLCGRSEAGKTTLTQALKGEDVHYVKTQYVKTWDITIDTPGEYAETKALARMLLVSCAARMNPITCSTLRSAVWSIAP